MKVFIIAALSADGYIGVGDSHNSTSWTTKADLHFFVRRTKEAGTVVMGRKTFETFGKPLKDRRLLVLTSKPGEEVTVPGVEATSESPAALVARLKTEGVNELAVCGGTSVYSQFMAAGLVDELYVSVMPKLFGRGVPLFATELDDNLALLETEKLDDNTILLHYRVV